MRHTKLTTPIGVGMVVAVLAVGIGVGVYRMMAGRPPRSSGKSDVADLRSDSTSGSEKRSGSEETSSGSEQIDLVQMWGDLASTDETIALRAFLKLSSASPTDTVPFLQQHLAAVKLDRKRVAVLVAKLDDNDFDIRAKATAELEDFGVCAVPFLERALEDKLSLEVEQRVRELLAKEDAGPPASWVRSRRAIALLEHIGSEDARSVLEMLSQGRTAAMPTIDAQAALDRLAERSPRTTEASWEDLQSRDEGKALVAILALAASREETVALLKKQVKAGLHDDHETLPRLPAKFRHSRPGLPLPTAACAALLLEHINNSESRVVLGEMREPPRTFDASLGAALSPDGKSRAAIDKDGKVLNFDFNGKLIFQIDPHKGGARSVAYSANGKTVASGGLDGAICLIDAGTGSITQQIRQPESTVLALAFSPDGKTLTSGDGVGKIRHFNLPDGKLKSEDRVHKDAVLALAYSADGKLLACGSADQTIRLFSADGKELAVHEGHKAAVVALVFSQDGKRLTSVDSNKTEHQWEVATGKLIK